MNPYLECLPVELLQRIAEFLHSRDLIHLRLTSQKLRSAATPALFRGLTLYPTTESLRHILHVSRSPELAKYVRCIRLHTEEEGFESEINPNYKVEWPLYFTKFRTIQFPGITSLTVNFDKMCWSPDGNLYSPYWTESHFFRTRTLRGLLIMLLFPHNHSIRALTIRNLQDVNEHSLVTGSKFKQVLSRLHTLRLLICTEPDIGAPECAIELAEVHQFTRELPSIWLAPTTSRLTHLTFYMDIYFGYAPKLDLRNVHFPLLQSLELGNFTFSHDWQLDWITSHGATLSYLSLDDCPILHEARSKWPLDDEGYPNFNSAPTSPIGIDEFPPIRRYRYSTRWCHYFTAFRTMLPHLNTFRWGISDWCDGNPLEDPVEQCKQPWRYVAYDTRPGGSHWLNPIQTMQRWAPKHYRDHELDEPPQFGEADQKALVRLLKKIGQGFPAGEGEELRELREWADKFGKEEVDGKC